ncbi:hypothetical protein A3C33_03470 [Candidatus Curtissbacteria bacterium RIFCSPHIGHO2_02_FULL_42_58]|nr:MAG: hypothetical protein A3C33_03470 [Candidatus Curtissbacteria bacterium RIFCSPHIGHO2_02_FULL_42_58]OGD96387.1 MAG: hypothetical protein A3E71_05055 [Candidatus Curtissbacteria bacterium RIFCSPHIGHO2_12_FULL_42_33]
MSQAPETPAFLEKPLSANLAYFEGQNLDEFANGYLTKQQTLCLFRQVYRRERIPVDQLISGADRQNLIKPIRQETKGGAIRDFYDKDRCLALLEMFSIALKKGILHPRAIPWSEIGPRLEENLSGTRLFRLIGLAERHAFLGK